MGNTARESTDRPDTAEQLGRAIDRVDSLTHGLTLPIPTEIHLDNLRRILPEVVRELKAGYKALTGDDPWG